MKNLPDDELFNKLKVRLQNIEEDPGDDVWTSIERELRPNSATHSRNRYALIVILMIMGLGREYWLQVSHSVDTSLSSPAPSTPSSSFSAANDAVQDDGDAPPHSDLGPSAIDRTSTGGVVLDDSDDRDYAGSNATPSNQDITVGNSGYSRAHRTDAVGETTSVVKRGAYDSHDQHSDYPIGTQQRPTIWIQPTIQFSDSPGHVPLRTDSAWLAVAENPDSAINKEVKGMKNAQKRGSRWRVYGMITPSLTFHHVMPSTGDDPIFERLNSAGVLSTERLTFSLEGGVQFPIAKRLHVFAGVSYYQQSMNLSLEQIIPGTSITPDRSMNFSFQPNTTTTTVNYRMQNVGVVSGLSYVISVGKIMHQLGGALQYEYGLIARTTDESDRSSNSFVNFRIFYRAEYGLNDRLSLFVQPVFSRSLMFDEVMNGAIKVKQSRAGIGLGIVYRLK